ncbi:MAG: hypothetical protein ISS78_07140 [Phycisphaerae bacterium]|nr:hypothetical protein [Phycisphaerae bacterium]
MFDGLRAAGGWGKLSGFVTVIRLGLLALYVTALVMFAKWTAQRPAPNPYSTQRY